MASFTRMRPGNEPKRHSQRGLVRVGVRSGIPSRTTVERRWSGRMRWSSFACLLIAAVWLVRRRLGHVCDDCYSIAGAGVPWSSGRFGSGHESSGKIERPVVAYAISITSLEASDGNMLLDAAEVLLHSILSACRYSAYRCEFIAFMKPTISPEAREQVEEIGWRVMEKDLPVPVEEIENMAYRERVVKTGCCGADEFIKLHAYTLTEYHRVLHLDVDTLVLHPLDELMEFEASLLYTSDPAMATKGQKSLPVQGGFLLVKPDMEVYERLRDVVREGDWRIGQGWRGSMIGYFYGGATIQGLLPYFYNVLAPGTALELNRCIYNHMSDSPECISDRYSPSIPLPAAEFDDGYLLAGGNMTATESGAPAPVLPIKTVHFTQSCMKPWRCMSPQGPQRNLCKALQKAWLEGRESAMQARGLPFTKACGHGRDYSALQRRAGSELSAVPA